MLNRLAKLETFSGIDDPQSGLRRDITDLRSAMRALEKAVAGINNRIYFATGACTIIGAILETIFRK